MIARISVESPEDFLCAGRLPERVTVAGGIFDAMEMQTVPVSKAFYEGRSIGRRWQMPPMQKHRV
jgi:hypothetical protein